jgi:hypothetical protein
MEGPRRIHCVRSRRVVRAAVACSLAHALISGAGLAQDTRVGRIERIAQLLAAPKPIRVETASERVQISRGASETWIHAAPNQDVLQQDQLRVQRHVDVRVKVERRTQRGWLTFLPEVLLQNGQRVFDVGVIESFAQYEIPDDATGGSELAVAIQSGALIVDWRAGRLRVVAAGDTALVTGTIAVFAVSADGNSGWLFVQEGTVALAGVAVAAGQIARLQRGVTPLISRPQPAQMRDYQTATRYNAQRVWSAGRPFFVSPQFLVPAVGLIAGATVYAVTQGGDDEPGPRRGTVIIRIPF